jgi:hypothetical protein
VVEVPPPVPVTKPAPPATPPLHWPSLFFTTLRFVLLGVAFPLATIHLWFAVAGCELRNLFSVGAKTFFKRLGAALAHAFSSDSVVIYGLGLIVFLVLPYIILVPTFFIGGNKTEFAFFGLRLLLAFVFSLVGWVATMATLARTVPTLPTAVPASNVVLQSQSAA